MFFIYRMSAKCKCAQGEKLSFINVAFFQPFHLFILKSKKCNVLDKTSMTKFCCGYIQNVTIYQSFVSIRELLLDGYVAL